MTKLSIGVVGAGVFGSYHAAKVATLVGARLSGVFDTDARRASALAERFGSRACGDFRDLLSLSDAVVIAAPAITHFDMTRAALEAGKHALVEKPLACGLGEARALVSLAAEKGLVLQVGHQERYLADAIGLFARPAPPRRIECVRHAPFSGRGEDVSAALDLMIHDLDLVARLAGGEAERISAEGNGDAIAAEIFLSCGALATFSASRRAPSSRRRITAIYDDGAVEFDFVRRTLVNSTPTPIGAALTASPTPLAVADPLAHGAKLFLDAVTGRSGGVSGEEALKALSWALAIENAAGIANASGIERARAR